MNELLCLPFIHVSAPWPVALLLTALVTEGIREMLFKVMTKYLSPKCLPVPLGMQLEECAPLEKVIVSKRTTPGLPKYLFSFFRV